jgi:SAM-dependent methyltransferase
MATVFFGVPTYKYDAHSALLGCILQMSRKHNLMYSSVDSSACCVTFNALLIQALESHERGGADWFLLWHSDIIPEPFFVDKMVDIAEQKNADILSVVVPIKDEKGLTSTALDEQIDPELSTDWRVRRLTMAEIMGRKPVNGRVLEPTFTDPKLLLNTGLMLVRLSAPWVKDIYFHFEDKIVRVNGRRRAVLMPEDWMFSKDARKLGCTSQWATRQIRVEHAGAQRYPNDQVWGWPTDTAATLPEDIVRACVEADKVRGYMAFEELARLADISRDKVVVEVGSWLGRSTKAIAALAKRVFAVDHWRGTPGGDATGEEAKHINPFATFCANLGPEINVGKVITLTRDHSEITGSMTYFDGVTQEPTPIGPVDVVFIDGAHDYDSVKRDIQNCLPLLKPGGLLCGHDMNELGVQKAVNEMLPGAKVVAGTIWEYKVPHLVAV